METLQNLGYLGLFIGSFLAATIVPFSSDVLLVSVLLLGGKIWLTVLVATIGNWLGSLTTYYLGWLGKWEWIEKWFKVTPEKLEKQQAVIEKYGAWIAFFSWLPFIGDIFSIGLGFYKIDFKKVSLLMLLGKATRFTAWGVLCYFFGADVQNIFLSIGG